MTAPVFDITDKEKFELEFVSTSELCHIATKCKEEIQHLNEKIRMYGESHEHYKAWKNEKFLKTRRRNYVLSRIKSRQLPLL
jgi:hypothetical protein